MVGRGKRIFRGKSVSKLKKLSIGDKLSMELKSVQAVISNVFPRF